MVDTNPDPNFEVALREGILWAGGNPEDAALVEAVRTLMVNVQNRPRRLIIPTFDFLDAPKGLSMEQKAASLALSLLDEWAAVNIEKRGW
jgi:hypothetical protein